MKFFAFCWLVFAVLFFIAGRFLTSLSVLSFSELLVFAVITGFLWALIMGLIKHIVYPLKEEKQ